MVCFYVIYKQSPLTAFKYATLLVDYSAKTYLIAFANFFTRANETCNSTILDTANGIVVDIHKRLTM